MWFFCNFEEYLSGNYDLKKYWKKTTAEQNSNNIDKNTKNTITF